MADTKSTDGVVTLSEDTVKKVNSAADAMGLPQGDVNAIVSFMCENCVGKNIPIPMDNKCENRKTKLYERELIDAVFVPLFWSVLKEKLGCNYNIAKQLKKVDWTNPLFVLQMLSEGVKNELIGRTEIGITNDALRHEFFATTIASIVSDELEFEKAGQ